MKNTANIITISRIFIAVWLIFIKPLSPCFYILYAVCGLTDMIDGTVARITNTQSKTGALLDSVADMVFCAVAAVKLLPTAFSVMPDWIYAVILLVITIRTAAYVTGFLKYHKFASRHTYLNKLTGFALFIVPYFLSTRIVWVIAAFLAVISAGEELIMNMKLKQFEPDRKSIITLRSVD